MVKDSKGNIVIAGLLSLNEGDVFVVNITGTGTVAYSKFLRGDYAEFRPKLVLNGTHLLIVGTTRNWGSTSRYGDEDILFLAVSYTDAPRNLTFSFSTNPPTYANQPEWIDTPLPYVTVTTITLSWREVDRTPVTIQPLVQDMLPVNATKTTLTTTWTATGTVSTTSIGQPIILRPILPVPKPPITPPLEAKNPEKQVQPILPGINPY